MSPEEQFVVGSEKDSHHRLQKSGDGIRDGIYVLLHPPEVQRNSSPLKNGGGWKIIIPFLLGFQVRSLLQGSPVCCLNLGEGSSQPRPQRAQHNRNPRGLRRGGSF